MSARGNISTAVAAIREGAFDFIEKRYGTDAMVARVREAIDGRPAQRLAPSDGGDPLTRPFPGCDRLTLREREVLSQITAAASSKEAAKTLGISQRTVEIHRAHIMQKLGARNAVDLARMVLSRGRPA
jgi:two-component system, LuxR family, response regulator FixJ